MPRLVWVTDPHLNFVTNEIRQSWLDEIRQQRPTAILLGGDVAEAPTLAETLRDLARQIAVPMYFVLGNHDFYRGSVVQVRADIRSLCQDTPGLHYLSESDPVHIGERTVLVGHDGWGDGRSGRFLDSDIVLNDYLLIAELRSAAVPANGIPPTSDSILTLALQARLHALGDESADHLRRVLMSVPDDCDEILVLTHVPPFREACWHAGRISDDNWAPHFVCEAAGRVLREHMLHDPRRRMTVLCGHTHGAGHATILPNLEVTTGGTEYGHPRVQMTLDVA